MYIYRLNILCCFALLLCVSMVSAQNVKSLKKLYDNQDYNGVIQAIGKQDIRDNQELLLLRGLSLSNLNQHAKAFSDFSKVKSNDPAFNDVNLYLGDVYRYTSRYKKAIKWYRKYLSNLSKENNQSIDQAVNLISQCSKAMALAQKQENIIIERCQGKINSAKDETHPVFSRTANNKIYLNRHTFDKSEIVGYALMTGDWSTQTNLPDVINKQQNNVLFDLSGDGQILFYSAKADGKTYSLYNKNEASEKSYFMQAPYFPHLGDCDLQIVNDKTIIFASRRPDSYGGYDLYTSSYANDKWSEPQNLGNTINSPNNEKAPFLLPNEQQLFFSSDRLDGIGGYDIYSAVKGTEWRRPKHMGIPLNSPKDDLDFRLNKSGLGGVISSNRAKATDGSFDIFQIYFNKPVSQQTWDDNHLTYISYGEGASSSQQNETIITKEQITETKSDTVVTQQVSEIVEDDTKEEDSAKANKKEEENTDTEDIVTETKKTKKPRKQKTEEKGNDTEPTSEVTEVKKKKRKKKARNKSNDIVTENKETKSTTIESNTVNSTSETEDINAKTKEIDKDKKQTKENSTIAEVKPKEQKTKKDTTTKKDSKPTLSDTITLSKLVYADKEDILNTNNLEILDRLTEQLKAQPKSVIVELTNHTFKTGPRDFELFSGINNVKPVVDYLINKGVKQKQIIVNTVGSTIPYIRTIAGSSESHTDLNQRIEINLYNISNDKTAITKGDDIPSYFKDRGYQLYKNVKEDYHYRVQFAKSDKNYKSYLLSLYNDVMVTKYADSDSYIYTIGFFQNYNRAKQLSDKLEGRGINTTIKAFYGALSISPKQAAKLASDYPTLKPFAESQND